MAATVKSAVMASNEPKGIHPFFNTTLRSVSGHSEAGSSTAAPTAEGIDKQDDSLRVSHTSSLTQTTLDSASKVEQQFSIHNDHRRDSSKATPSGANSLPAENEYLHPESTPGSHQSEDSTRKRRKVSPPTLETPQNGSSQFNTPERQAMVRDILDTPTEQHGSDANWNAGEDVEKHDAVSLDDKIGKATQKCMQGDGRASDAVDQDEQNQRPRKVLKLNGKGSFGSPLSKKPKAEDNAEKDHPRPKTTRRGRPRKTFMLVLNYGMDDVEARSSLGSRIDEILCSSIPTEPMDGPVYVPSETSAATQTSTVRKAENSSKTTHPFFLGKVNEGFESSGGKRNYNQSNSSTAHSPAKIKSFSTPSKMRYRKTTVPDDISTRHSNTSFLHQEGKTFKLAGTVEPYLPWIGVVRVHPESEPMQSPSDHTFSGSSIGQWRKQKSKTIFVPPEESVVSLFSKVVDRNRMFSRDNVVLPRRIVMSCIELADLVKGKIHRLEFKENYTNHPACSRLLRDMGTFQSSFDKGEYEDQPWCQKYAPRTSLEVLQSRKELNALKTWLDNLAINKVESGTRAAGVLDEKRAKRKSKKRKKTRELDDFIVSSDGEDMEMHDLSSSDHDETDRTSSVVRSVVQTSGNDASGFAGKAKGPNAVLISGPHGCGKTAAAYAVAKELGYSVFELNPGSRRSGKDILDKVGDMASNHQVSKGELLNEIQADHDESVPLPEPDQLQSTLGSFFGKSKNSGSKPTKIPETHSKKEQKESAQQPRLVRQKQSLVLLEEVDILFDEDKHFWETLMDLIHRSKRPFILTCNDESLVPLEEMNLHGIFRFRAPQEYQAVPHLLTIAAREGHLLEYTDIRNLYEAHGRDLRHAITTLNFWCQMAVGDQKGGMEWMLKRWPPGADIDEQGRKVRVISDRTYRNEMLLMNGSIQNAARDNQGYGEDLLLDAWSHWDIKPSETFEDALETAIPSSGESGSHIIQAGTYNSLLELERYMDHQSSLDIYSTVDLPSAPAFHEVLDTTQPPAINKSRSHYLEGFTTLQADLLQDHKKFDAQITTWMYTSLIYSLSRNDSTNLTQHLLLTIPNRRASISQRQQTNRAHLHTAFSPLDASSPIDLPTTISTLTTEIAPYVRSIAAFDLALDRQRQAMQAGTKRPRTTRASRSALEGSQRAVTRRECWFPGSFDLEAVVKTGGAEWRRGVSQEASMEGSEDELQGGSQE